MQNRAGAPPSGGLAAQGSQHGQRVDMAVRIRLRRTGKLSQPCHRIVVADGRSPRDGRFIENIGFYDPRHDTEKVDLARADHWIKMGAQPTDTVNAILKRARDGKPFPGVGKQKKKDQPAAEA
jgi:small subunit ribosomal protein S16